MEKIGTKLANEDVAGTEHELNLALDSYHKRRKPDIKAFFKVIDESEKMMIQGKFLQYQRNYNL